MPSYQPVNALLRGLEVLTVVNRNSGKVSVGDIHHHTGIDKATIVRMLETLIHAGFIERHRETPHYEVTGKALLLSSGYDRHRAVGAVVAPVMKEFRNKVGWPSDVAIFDGDQVLVVETSREAGPLLLSRHPGYQAPLLATSLGLAYLAFLEDAEREVALESQTNNPQPWNDIARDKKLAKKTFQQIRKQGFALMHPEYSFREYDNKIGSIGVPILSSQQPLAAINVLFLKNVLPVDRAEKELLEPLQAVAHEISVHLKETMNQDEYTQTQISSLIAQQN